MTEGQTNYVRYLLPGCKTKTRILEAKLTPKSLRKGSTECTKDVWLPVEQIMSRMGARAETGSRNMAVMAEIESSTPNSYLSPIACMDLFPAVWPQTHYFRFSKPKVVFQRQNWRPNRWGMGLLSVWSIYGHCWQPITYTYFYPAINHNVRNQMAQTNM